MYGVYLPRKPKRVLVLGSGALQIGQAGEFDYSGSQAIKALREEGIYTVLVNPNIATIQTSQELADRVYLVAVIPSMSKRSSQGRTSTRSCCPLAGQTALNCGVELARTRDSGQVRRSRARYAGRGRSATPRTASASTSGSMKSTLP